MISPTRIMLALRFLRKKFPWIHQLFVTSARLLVVRSVKTWFQNMVGHPIPCWGCSSWYCMMHPQHLPIFCLLFHQEVCSHILLVSSSWMLLCPLWDFLVWSIHCFPHSGSFPPNNCRWCGQFSFEVFYFTIFIRLGNPHFSTLSEHQFIADTLVLGFHIIVIIRLVV